MIALATRDEINADTETSFGRSIDVGRYLDKGEAYALSTDAGVALFVLCGPETYKITLALAKSVSGTQTKASINAAFQWVFENTDAQELRGFIADTNTACLAMVPQTYGYTLIDVDGGKMYSVTKDRWESERLK